MEPKQKSSSLKAIVIILCLLLFGSLAYIFKMASDANSIKKELTEERDGKQQILAELNELKTIYDQAIEDNTALSDDLIAEREKVMNLIDDLKKSKINAAEMSKFKDAYFKLKNQMKILVAENDELKSKNLLLETKIDSTAVVLNSEKDYNKKLSNQNDELAKKVDLGSKLIVSHLKSKAVRVKSSGKKSETDRANRADQIEVCFRVGANSIANKGVKKYFVQLIDSKGNIVGDTKTENFGANELTYSFESSLNYDGNLVEFCDYLSVKNLVKGVYFVNLFDQSELIAKTSFTLK